MELSDIFDDINPICLYCLIPIVNINAETNFIENSTEYSCSHCEEFFLDLYLDKVGNSGHYFSFSCKDLMIDIHLLKEEVSISKIEHVTIPIVTRFPVFQFDFSDKEKLYLKLKTYLSFS